MARQRLTQQRQDEVLVASRRRCSICFGINRDTGLKAGQIAHLDKDNTNANFENLAFLCLGHHDEYDSSSSQRKNFTIGEVKRFREELYDALGKAFSVPSHFGDVSVPPSDPVAGRYTRIGDVTDSADITITPLPDDVVGTPRYFISGFALAGTDREFGPNMGELAFVGEFKDGVIEGCLTTYADGPAHIVKLKVGGGGRMHLEERDYLRAYGMGVTFQGLYDRGSGRP